MRVALTGANGFIGRNAQFRLREKGWNCKALDRNATDFDLAVQLADVDALIHLAGVNRPVQLAEFDEGNWSYTRRIARLVEASSPSTLIIYASSTQAAYDNAYGESKQRAEQELELLSARNGNPVLIYRLPNVFGKWSRPNYNSVVATFCYNVARSIPVMLHDANTELTLAYVDDVLGDWESDIQCDQQPGVTRKSPSISYLATVQQILDSIYSFRESRSNLMPGKVGKGLVRALYSTYQSFLPTVDFSYPVPKHGDARGDFVEVLKTSDSGQFSYFTAAPGVTRGGHYHHTKTEKFLILHGTARFRFEHIVTGERTELTTHGGTPQIVETIPGWNHDITNIGTETMIVMLWANEIFDRERPDTYRRELFDGSTD